MDTRTATLLNRLKDKNVVVFDGECVLCSRFFRFLLARDKRKQFHFMTAQSPAGEALYAHFGLKAEDYDTNLVLIEGRLFERLDGFFEAMKLIGWPWRVVNVFSVLPSAVLDRAYYAIALNRYRLFGRRDTCLVPDGELRARFID